MSAADKDFREAIHFLGRKFNIDIPVDTPKKARVAGVSPSGSYCERMLAESGLTPDDTIAYVPQSDGSLSKVFTFHSGSIDVHGNMTAGDDVVIEYFDLDGHPITYERKDYSRKKTGVLANYFRVRWQYPEAHLDKDKKSYKYKSPWGSGTPIYIPQSIRNSYNAAIEIPCLFIQEGEKKAEKACKHGIPSVAISGIMNFCTNGRLSEDFIRLVKRCKVKRVVFLMDSDWNDLSHEIKLNEDVSKRPRNFFFAARNFMKSIGTLKTVKDYDENYLFIDPYIGHTIAHNGDKGIDDLLANTLSGKEKELVEDIEHAMTMKVMEGRYVHLYLIKDFTESRLETLWYLNSVHDFYSFHKDVLVQLPEFLFGKNRYTVNTKGEVVNALSFEESEKFWTSESREDRNGNIKEVCSFGYYQSCLFLQNRGFWRYKCLDEEDILIRIEFPFVSVIKSTEARDFLVDFAKSNCSLDVINMLYRGHKQFLGKENLSMLEYYEPDFLPSRRDEQYLFFKDFCWKISSRGVDVLSYLSLTHYIWSDRRSSFESEYLGPLVLFEENSGHFDYSITPAGEHCDFLRFLINSSDFTWRKTQAGEDISDTEAHENAQHLLSKLCAIGYMSMDYKDPNVTRAVIAMDGKMSEVGESNGRSGKSLLGELMRHVTTIAYINGKKRDILDDQFIWNDVTEKTRLVFIDDVLMGFNFEALFPCITGDWSVNYKGGRRVTFPFSTSPKIYIPTNHAVKGDGSSYSDRQWLLAFSDYYNDAHKPVDDFGSLFFAEWGPDQWNLMWNLVANCIQLYLRFGVIQAPNDRIEQRRLRQEITEGFLMWADDFFSDPSRFHVRHSRRDLQEKYFEAEPNARKYCTPTEFKKRFRKYCQYKGWIFNPHMFDPLTGTPYKFDRDGRPILDDKAGGIEYFTVGKPGENPPSSLESSDPLF